jgi:hypothetical protein
MVIVMNPQVSDAQIESVCRKLEADGFKVHRSTGVTQTVLGAIGNTQNYDPRELMLLMVNITSNAVNQSTVTVLIRGTAVVPGPDQPPELDAPPGVEFGPVVEEQEVEREVSLSNLGLGPLTVLSATTTAATFEVAGKFITPDQCVTGM